MEATYTTQTVLHNCLETHQSVCRWVGETLEVHTSTQYVWGVRERTAAALGIAPEQVRVVCEYMGGGFGSKTEPGDYTLIAARLARATGRPVRCALTRREENVAAGNRNGTIQRLVAGARADGTLTALGGDFVNLTGWSGWSSMTEGPMQMLYACPNVRTTTHGARLNLPPMKAFRAPGFVEGTFGLECLLDELAAKLDLDPLELRRRNHSETDPADDRRYSSKQLLECYRRAEPHWERRHEVRARSTATVKRGVGLASQVWFGGGGPPSYAWVRVSADGRATVVTATQDIGTGVEDGARADRRGGARPPARGRLASRSATRRAARTRRSRRARRRSPPWARRRALRPPTRSGRSSTSRRSATGRRRTSRTASSSSPTGRAGRSTRSSACSATARSSAPAPAARTRPA